MRGRKIEAVVTMLMAFALMCPSLRAEVLFTEDFESGELGGKWEVYREGEEYGGFETREEFVHTGGMSYRITGPVPTGEGRMEHGRYYKESDSWIRTWLKEVQGTIYIRWYAKFSQANEDLGMHWCQFWGTRQDNARKVLGGAGRRPDGTDRFIANVEPGHVGGDTSKPQIRFYTYWPDMKQSPDGKYWGNYFYPEQPFYIEKGRWYCYEFMLNCNEPGKSDGEQALWIDGEKAMLVSNMRWRDVKELGLKMAMFGNYRGRANTELTYWLDDIIMSTEYVGPKE